MYELLANGLTAADSSAMTVVPGTPVTVAITYDPAFLPRNAFLDVLLETVAPPGDNPGHYVKVGRLSSETPALLLVAPGSYIVRRENLVEREIATNIGAVTSSSSGQ